MVAAVILTAKGEFDLAVLAHFSPWIAWMFPVMIDVYVITAFHRRRWKDMVIGMLLMIFCQIAVHLLPVYITEGEETPWGLVVAVACIAPIVVVRVKILTGRTGKEIAAAEEAARRAEEVRAARAETAAARAAQAEAERSARAETARAEAEAAARIEAETRAAEAEMAAQAQAEKRAEIEAATEAEIAAHAQAASEAREAVRVAEQRAGAAVEAARLAEGRLAEARDAADRAAAARTLAEQTAGEQVRILTEAAEQAERDYQQALAEARYTAQAAQDRASELDETVRALRAQLDEAQRFAERQSTARALAEQEAQAIKDARDGLVNELERTRRALARAQEKAETSSGRQPEIVRPAARKSLAAVPAQLPDNLPEVDKVRPETVALVLIARAENPDAKQTELAAITGISDRTIRKVLNTVPAEIVGQVLELTA
ncbi:hypothetical protein DLJ47_18095 [Micromonospora sp. S4605]|uniref:hypothetical protein n=1 Tax=Micromonospora sp. S4605 TaxID=1420897 RepID=UPI000D70469D|nr:hypothetical protein [Micromonospora sp. S4605]PWU52780.1 hypothetical protein DLJ47_18095 [Micromonospora sp. S4605]